MFSRTSIAMLKKIDEAATQGRWLVGDKHYEIVSVEGECRHKITEPGVGQDGGIAKDVDVKLICWMRNNIKPLLEASSFALRNGWRYSVVTPTWNKGIRGYYVGERGGGYQAIHKWLKKHFGKASKCEGTDCKKITKTYHWAKVEGKSYEHKRENFIQLCASCHRRYDKKPEWIVNMSRVKLGKRLSEETKAKISRTERERGVNKGNKHSARKVIQMNLDGSFVKEWSSAKEAAVALNLQGTSISRVCGGKLNKTGNFLWKYANIQSA